MFNGIGITIPKGGAQASLAGGSSFEGMRLLVRTPSPNQSFTIGAVGGNSLDINWGDGTVETGVTDNSPTHTYADAGDYVVTVAGTTNDLSFNSVFTRGFLIEVQSMGPDFTAGDLNMAFGSCPNLTSFNSAGAETPPLTNLTNMLFNSGNLVTADLSGFDFSNVSQIGGVFASCSDLVSVDLGDFDASNVTSLSSMFFRNESMTSLDISGWDTSGVTNMANFLRDCTGLTSDPGLVDLDISSMNVANGMCEGANDMLSTAEYDAILVAWEAQSYNNNVSIHFGDATYTAGSPAATARANLVNDGWTITDGGTA